MNTGQSVTRDFKLEILPVGEYDRRVAAGLITIKTLNIDEINAGGEDADIESIVTDVTAELEGTTMNQVKVVDCSHLEALGQKGPLNTFNKEASYDDLLSTFMKTYGTAENWLRSYGGEVKFDN